MNFYLLIALLCCIVIIIFMLVRNSKKQRDSIQYIDKLENLRSEELKQYFREEWEEKEKELEQKVQIKEKSLEKQWTDAYQKHQLQLSNLDKEILNLESVLSEKEKRYNEVNQDLEVYKKGKIEEINSAAAEYEQRKRLENAKAIEEHNNSMKKASAELQEQLLRSEQVLKDEIKEIKAELEVERSKRAAINEEILRQRQVEENQDFYRIQLDPKDKNDIEILRDIAPRLRKPEAINKIIWQNYYQKPLAELRKRAAIEGPGVYKITRMKTNEIYIGQAVNISTRWSEHCKAALGVGTLASSQLHRVMAEDGPEQFVFEVLEEVPKEKLRERESYYIDFYDSKNCGLNSISGSKK